MNWYKYAQSYAELSNQEKKRDFLSFYAMQGLSDEIFAEHPELLYNFIEELNKRRQEYLNHLGDSIGMEIEHFLSGKREIIDIYSGPFVVNENIVQAINAVINKLLGFKQQKGTLIKPEVDFLISLFRDFNWFSFYGGKKYAIITEAYYDLLKAGPIIQAKYNPVLMGKIRKLVEVIDRIHSIHHNLGHVLNYFLDGSAENRWLMETLFLVKNVSHPAELAYLAKNPRLSEIYNREVLPLTGAIGQYRSEFEAVKVMEETPPEKIKNILENIDNEELMIGLIKIYGYMPFIETVLAFNPNTAKYLKVVQELYQNQQNKKFLTWDFINKRLRNSPYISQEVLEFLDSVN